MALSFSASKSEWVCSGWRSSISLLELLSTSEIHVARDLMPSDAVDLISSHLDKLAEDARFKNRIHSLGVTVPGIVTAEGFVINLPILGWKSVDLLAELSKRIDLPSFVENNANAAAFGAVYTQPSLPSVCTIFLKLGTGCGGAAIVNGRLLRGANGTAGEFGHIRLSDEGAECSCGQRGCLESWANLGAMARRFRRKRRTLGASVCGLAGRDSRRCRRWRRQGCRGD